MSKNNKNKYWVVIDAKEHLTQLFDNVEAFNQAANGENKINHAFKSKAKAEKFINKWKDKFSECEKDTGYDQFVQKFEATRSKKDKSTNYWVIYDSEKGTVEVYTNKTAYKNKARGKGKSFRKFPDGHKAYTYIKECKKEIKRQANCEKAKSEKKKPKKYWVVYDKIAESVTLYDDQATYMKAIEHKKGLIFRAFKKKEEALQFVQKCQDEIDPYLDEEAIAFADSLNFYDEDEAASLAEAPASLDEEENEDVHASYDEAIDDLISHDEQEDEIPQEVYKENPDTDFKRHMIAFVDGSYSGDMYGYGAVMITPDGLHQLSGSGNAPELTELKNVAGELMAVTNVINCAQIRGYTSLTISYDFAGIEKYLDGKNKNPLIQGYASYVAAQRQFMDITFCKVKAHSSNFLNDLADKLAKRAAKQANNMRVTID
jgi:ribonuclease HI